jgi:ABC-type amino acid transport substrate-binding protein
LILISKKTGIQFKREADSWNNLMEKMDQGSIDLLPAISRTSERAERYHFTPAYHKIGEYVFAKDDETFDPKKVEQKTFALVKGYSSVDRIKKAYPDVKILEFDTIDGAITAVVTGKADYIYDSLSSISNKLKELLIDTMNLKMLRKVVWLCKMLL